MNTHPDILNAALSYSRAGLCVLPARLADKRPALSSWKAFQTCRPNETQIQEWFKSAEALCILCGAVSGNGEMIDFDNKGEHFDAWCNNVRAAAPALLDRLAIETTQNIGKHVAYRCSEPVCGNIRLAERSVIVPDGAETIINGKKYKPRKTANGWEVVITLIETRGQGGLFLCAPTPGYTLEQGGFDQLPVITPEERDILLSAAYALNERIPEPQPTTSTSGVTSEGRPGDDFNQRGDVRSLLLKHGWKQLRSGENEHWARPGKVHGTSATFKDGVFYVFSSNAAPFEQNKAYSPFTAYALLEHGGDFSAAAAMLRTEGFGTEPTEAGVNIDAIVGAAKSQRPLDPGPIPIEMLRVPGFISEVMDHCLLTAPYPNPVLAFCGALSLQAMLAGRKVRDAAGNRTNVYLLGLAHSATGKDWPRRLNMRIAHRVGLASAVAERFASGEGLQDALFSDPCMLFQTDEIDGLFRLVNGAQDSRYENIITQLLMMYSSASTIFPMRKLAKQESRIIDQPCLVLFGTAIPNHYYDALSSRMLTNGLFARMLVFESGPRAKGKDALDIDPAPQVMETANWWAKFLPGSGNIRTWHPEPAVVEQTEDAKRFLSEAREDAEREYAGAEQKSDALSMTVWGRVDEQTRKLALLYAISASHLSPSIDLSAVKWAHTLVMHQTKRMLFMASSYVADNPFEAECLKFIRMLRQVGGSLAHSAALKNMHMPAELFSKLVQTLEQRGEVGVGVESAEKQGRPMRHYKLLGA